MAHAISLGLHLAEVDAERLDRVAGALADEIEQAREERVAVERGACRLRDRGFDRRGRCDLAPAEPRSRGSAPAQLWHVRGQLSSAGAPARVGVIASVTRPFCGTCDRTRLTADGQVRTCLFAREESDLRLAMRSGASDAELADRWVVAMAGKLPGHGIDDPTFLQPDRPMSAIGG